ncbi:MAG: squalene synthase HpnC [Chloroflexi bacterium]|nr:squalene synthase HpnC [Chloroflexota bacterium]
MNTPASSSQSIPSPRMVSAAGTPDYVTEAFAHCETLARSHYENFSVGTRLIPGKLRKHFYSVYAFCRGVDDLGDEATGDRLAMLDEWERQLNQCYEGTPEHPFFVALQQTIREFDIPREPFLKLVEANRRDQRIRKHPSYKELLDSCDHSANPVGHLVLYIFGHREPALHRLSDSTCTALQLANFWQDVQRDYEMGRVYLPADDMAKFGVTEDIIANREATREFKALMRFEIDRTRQLFVQGYELVGHVNGIAKVDLALFTGGGLTILRSIEKLDYDVLTKRPEVSKLTKFRLLVSAYTRSRLGMRPLSKTLFRQAGA